MVALHLIGQTVNLIFYLQKYYNYMEYTTFFI